MNNLKRRLFVIACAYIYFNVNCLAQTEISTCFEHEYVVLSCCITGEGAYPVRFDVMADPKDFIEIDLSCTDSVVNSILEHSLEFNDFSNVEIYHDIYGNTDEVNNAYWFSMSDFNYNFFNKCETITYSLYSGENLTISYLSVIGLFLKYPSNRHSIISSYGSVPINHLVSVCPLNIFMYKKTNNLIIRPKARN